MQFLYYALFAAGIVAVDQLSKYFTVAYIPLIKAISFIPGVLNLTYVQNSGAAFSSFEGQQWLFALIFLFFTGLIVWEYFKKKMAFTPFERWCIAAIYGGGFANMVDRLRMGYVVDMIETAFVDFPVFNVADCFITCGCVTDVCRAVRDAALPKQPAIVCFERYPEIIKLLKTGEIACTISGDLLEQGRLAMRFLFEYIIYDRAPKSSTVYTKNEIIIEENA